MNDPAQVAIVFEDNPKLVERLVSEMQVWASRTERTEDLAPRLRGEGPANGVDLTIFNFDPAGDIEEQLLGLIYEVELHHGASGGRSPLERLDVYGARLTKRTTTALEQLGLPSVEAGAEGFSAAPSDG